ncbi:adenine phosphoribosyltransferase [Chloroflexi bacterium TSY]|nr:adenine phosphoribosyltransferase [Chloroflexi bacterium TSY]
MADTIITPGYNEYIRNWPGNARSDLTHLLSQPDVFARLIEDLASPFIDEKITHVATVDAGGFPLGGGIAHRLRAGLVMIRKGGRIDWSSETIVCVDFSGLEKQLEITSDAVTKSDRVLVVDDWSETGGQLRAAIQLVERLGAEVVGAACLHIDERVRKDPKMAKYRLRYVIE